VRGLENTPPETRDDVNLSLPALRFCVCTMCTSVNEHELMPLSDD
jgi:hypothetical protein